MSVTFTLRGDKAMLARIRALVAKFPSAIENAIYLEAELVMTDSKDNYVPFDDGTLRGSGHVQRPRRWGRNISVTMAYGGAAAPYALPIHEHPSKYDPPTWKGKGTASSGTRGPAVPGVVTFHPARRGPKYLERPLNKALRGMAGRIARHLNFEAMG